MAGGVTNLQTRLLALQEAKRPQDVPAQERAFYQEHPEYLLGGSMPQTTLGGLSTPASGALTQQAFGPGGMGQAQTVPQPQDLSRFATGQPPSTLAGLGSQPQANPLEQ